MLVQIRRAVVVSVIFFVLLGLAYPAVETLVGNVFFSHQAGGSLTANGSTLVGQQWTGPKFFQGRDDPDNPAATGSANWGPRSEAFVKHPRGADPPAAQRGRHPDRRPRHRFRKRRRP